jgi:alkylation response protein AidB-like acyl-CoA dehydrogenase
MLVAAAEGVGAMQGALDSTVEYTRQREQFGHPLSSFQALQHRMAEMLIQTELARSLVLAACRAWDTQADNASTLALAAKAKVDAAARSVTQEAIQMHGGIATTNEYKVGHYFKRMALLESWPQHRDALIAEFIQRRQG